VDAAAETAIGAGDYVLTANDPRVAQNAVGDELRGSTRLVAWLTTPGISILARQQFGVLPHPPFVLVPHIGGLEGIGLRLDLEDQIDDVLEREIVGVGPMLAAQHKR
jgi:hypothetical protein